MESFRKLTIKKRAEEKWNNKDSTEKERSAHKYSHIFKKIKKPCEQWDLEFSLLNKFQQSILIKGELIRTYDSLSNHDKTEIKKEFGLTTFSSKWYKLPSCDKKKLLEFITH